MTPVDCSPPGSSVHVILQARILEWVAISFPRRSSPPRDQTWVSQTADILYRLSHQGSHLGVTHRVTERHTHAESQEDTHTQSHRKTHTCGVTGRHTHSESQRVTHTQSHRKSHTRRVTESHTHAESQRITHSQSHRESHTRRVTERHSSHSITQELPYC